MSQKTKPQNRQSRQPPSNEVMQRTAADINIEEIDEENRIATLSFVSEQPVNRWFGQEVLQVDEKSMDLSRFKNGLGCLLFNHNRNSVLGKVIKVWAKDLKGYAQVQFDKGEEEDKIFEKVKSKTLRGTSVGYNPMVWEKVAAGAKSTSGRVKGPAYVAVKWEPLEISITSVPADGSVGIGRSIEENDMEGKNMEDENNTDERGITTETEGTTEEPSKTREQQKPEASPNHILTKEEIIKSERQRTIEITTLCREFGEDPAKFIEQGDSLDKVRSAILEIVKKKNEPSATVKRFFMGEDETDKFKRAATDAIMIRGGLTLEKPEAGAQELRNLSLRDMMVECLERAGEEKVRYMDMDDLIRSSGMGTGALPGILSNVVNKTMSNTYKATPTTFEIWTREGSVNDFKETPTYTLSEAGSLVEIKESGEFKNDTFKEAETKRKVLTYGRKWALTRQMIINDDLSALTVIPQRYTMAARRGINRLVYKTLIESKLFAAKNGNIAAVGDLPNVKSLSEGRKAMRLQKNIKGEETLNIKPHYIIIPAAIETMTEQFLYSITDPTFTNANVKNPFNGKLNIVCDADIDDLLGGATPAWWLAAHQGEADTIQVDYLRGQKTPKIQSIESFDTLGWKWRIYFDYGVTMTDHKGMFKNIGKA